MKYFTMALAAALIMTACKKSEVATDDQTTIDSVAVVDQTTVATDSTAINDSIVGTPPMNYGDEGRVYVSQDGDAKFRVLSDGNESLSFKNEITGEIFKMKQVRAASGEKYEDANGNFMWFKCEEFLFGKGEENISSGKLQK